jgi:hypothetical protein
VNHENERRRRDECDRHHSLETSKRTFG